MMYIIPNKSHDYCALHNTFDIEILTIDAIQNFNGIAGGCSHITQLLWATSTYIGCARIQYVGKLWNGQISVFTVITAPEEIGLEGMFFKLVLHIANVEVSNVPNAVYKGFCGNGKKFALLGENRNANSTYTKYTVVSCFAFLVRSLFKSI